MTNKEIAAETFESGIAEELSRDMIIVNMVKAGLTLNTAQHQYKDLAQAAGISSAKVGFKDEALAHLDELAPDILDDETRTATRAALQEKFGVATSTANDYIKAWAVKMDIELPKSNFGSNPEEQGQIFDWIVANPNCDKATFKSFMVETMGRSSGSIDETYRGIVLARNLQDAGVVFEVAVEEAA